MTIIGQNYDLNYATMVCKIVGFQKFMSYYEFSSPHLFGTSRGRTYDVIIRDGTLYMKRNNTCYHGQIRSFRCTSGKFLYIKFNYQQAHCRVTFVTKKVKNFTLNGYSSWCKYAINKFLIDNSASCWSQDIQVFFLYNMV